MPTTGPKEGPSDSNRGTVASVTFTHVVSAPPDRTFRLWTEREHLMHWFAPPGVIITSCTVDLRVGGAFHYTMKTPDGAVVSAKWTYRSLQAPGRFEAIVAFSDEAGGTVRAPWDAEWPLETDSVVTLEPQGGKSVGTLVKVVWSPLNATATELKHFADGRDDMTHGWNATFESLDHYLGKH